MNTAKIITCFALVLLASGFSGCSGMTVPGYQRLSGEPYLWQGIALYEEGNYRAASRRLLFALEEGLTVPDRVQAHKYLAFIACVSGRQLTCREEFAIALKLDPSFELDEAEAGHPIWGPVFRSAKAAAAPRR
ncbi:MAG: TssQ family T6SS-associated lipoprotein [Burkholderiales bacterium]